jgi:hypothetical protein
MRAPASPRHFVLFLPLAALLLAGSVRAASSYDVVLRDGRVVAARTRPAIAMGKVSFVDATSHVRTLSVATVNVAATRERCAATPSSGRVWDQRSLATMQGRVQFAADTDAPVEAAPEQAASTPGEVDLSSLSDAERLRLEISQLDQRMQPLSATDHQRTVLVTRQRELQEELQRILGG